LRIITHSFLGSTNMELSKTFLRLGKQKAVVGWSSLR